MQTRFILGPAGSGKTFRCLAEIRQALADDPGGPPLLLIAPKQTTYQLERQLLEHSSVSGYTRLHILSFDRLAFFLFDLLKKPAPRMLDEEGRLMVLRGLLAQNRDQLKLYRASARLTGFAQHLSESLRELQRCQLTPETLHQLARNAQSVEGLSHKLHDLATMLQNYLDWLQAHALEDADHLLDFATAMLRAASQSLDFGDLWVDGFTEFSPQELELLGQLVPHVRSATLTFCLDHMPTEKASWLSTWSVARQTYQKCRARLAGAPGCEITTELLERDPGRNRFAGNAALRHLETSWADAQPFAAPGRDVSGSLRIAACPTHEAEAVLAAREILQFVRRGGRYREITVLARNLDDYHDLLVSTFTRYEIPFFLDRRESVAHHPLAELTRNALRTVTSGWKHDDWFAALKTSLVRVADSDVDHLENEALAHGWKGSVWGKPLNIPDDLQATAKLERVRARIVPPFHKFEQQLAMSGRRPTGPQLAAALRTFWNTLDVEDTLRDWSEGEDGPEPIHLTVWEQMGAWLRNVELAFPTETCSMQEWLPIVEAGLGNLTVGAIPPALDQVLIGAIDRSRNPDIRLAIVLGVNESVFPAPPKPPVLLTESDREALEKQGVVLSSSGQQHVSLERFYGYLACTRARERLVLTHCLSDIDGTPLNPSPFLAQIRKLFPNLGVEVFSSRLSWHESQHTSELIEPLLRDHLRASAGSQDADKVSTSERQMLAALGKLPALKPLRDSLKHFAGVAPVESLSPALAEQLYGAALRTSVSRMEQFAACPFKFFVHSGLRAEERKRFELDVRDQGNFQHEVLMQFHNQLRAEGKRWRDISPANARDHVEKIAVGLAIGFREGIMHATEQNQFTARVLTESLQDFVETLIGWMQEQYAFDPVRVELPFEQESGEFPAWKLELGSGRHLSLQGRIDRVDVHREGQSADALCVVVDYKSSPRQLDPLLMEHGLQLQLPAYLNVLRHWPNPAPLFGVGRLIPGGVFYVNLRGRYESGGNRDDALADVEAARKRAYRHMGRFDASILGLLDQRADATEGDQFSYRRKKGGGISANSRDPMDSNAFMAMLDGVETALKQMGQGIYAGEAKLDPYRKGRFTACDYCEYQSVCRIDPWAHSYRVLRKKSEAGAEG